jgi:hypothetical protein
MEGEYHSFLNIWIGTILTQIAHDCEMSLVTADMQRGFSSLRDSEPDQIRTEKERGITEFCALTSTPRVINERAISRLPPSGCV